MDGYTYMIERNKLMIQNARNRELASPSAPQPTGTEADDHALWRDRLMDLYSELEACGRAKGRGSE